MALPRPPQRLEDTGLDFSFLLELLTKILLVRGQMRLAELSAHSKLPPSVLEPVLTFMEYLGKASDLGGPCTTFGLAGGTVGPMVPVLVH